MPDECRKIRSPSDAALGELCDQLRVRTATLDRSDVWPVEQLNLCARYGVFEWFASADWQGQQWNESDLVRGYMELSAACLTTAFIITQRTGAAQRIERSENAWLKQHLLPDLVSGTSFATVGISHLTTSRRHLQQPVLRAEETDSGFVLDGYSPWVTGAAAAKTVVIGATLANGEQILAALPMDAPGVEVPPAPALMGLASSQTAAVNCRHVKLDRKWLIAGPAQDVMKQGIGARTGGLQTSALAIGLSKCAVDYLVLESQQRPELSSAATTLLADWHELRDALIRNAGNQPACTDAELRARANSFVLRASQAAMATAKGTGYVAGHPAGRWCREALFFLVWSCPQPVVAANLCEFAGIGDG